MAMHDKATKSTVFRSPSHLCGFFFAYLILKTRHDNTSPLHGLPDDAFGAARLPSTALAQRYPALFAPAASWR
ncbi:hypothetical protein IF1G_03030 [Cordyceps javanica]|uniref:Uncharacterized protein n=1 Tax=Cordyceps javanica TaxID=43265 RepID=A0A545VB64_9HYPO|nr:hypothetical protein IF1G_03030 [Cordyceps javanica]